MSTERPHIVLILADDMGFSDIGCYGSEIRTPNPDRPGGAGIRFTQAYNCARCCPTRAALLTGLYPHQAGVGHMVNNLGHKPYQGYLRDGRWKLVSKYPGDWELYAMVEDRTELNDLAQANKSQVEKTIEMYAAWADECGALPWDQVRRR